jgi:hypothetical protein
MSAPSERRTPEERAASAATASERAQIAQRHAEAELEYRKATDGLHFTKDFYTNAEAVIRDPMMPPAVRFLTWVKRYSWGENALFAKGADGHPKYQVDFCRETGLKKSLVSKTVAWLQMRGHLENHPKLLIAPLHPELTAPESDDRSPRFRRFLEWWKVACSADFEERKVHAAAIARIDKVKHSLYKKWQTAETNGDASLYRLADQGPDPGLAQVSSLLEEQSVQSAPDPDAAKELPQDGPECTPDAAPPTPLEESNRRGRQREEYRERTADWTEPEAYHFMFGKLAALQDAFPNSEFAHPRIDPEDPYHQAAVSKMLQAFGTHDQDYLMTFWLWVVGEVKGLGQRGKGYKRPGYSRAPGDPTGPESLGLMVFWARDYAKLHPYASGRAGGASG